MKTTTEKKISQQDLFATLSKALGAITAERKSKLRNLWRQDLNLIPKAGRIWIDVGLMAYVSIISIALPAYWALTTSNVTDICLDAIMCGTVIDLMLGLFIYRAIRKGKVPKDVLTKPFSIVGQWIRRIINHRTISLVVIMALGLMASLAMAETNINSSPEEKRAWQEQQEIESGEYKVQDANVSVHKFNELLDKDHAKEMANLDRIKTTGIAGTDNEGRVEYTTPDGTKHGFRGDNGEAITREEHIAKAQADQQFRKDKIYQKEMTMEEIDAKLAVSRKALDQQEKNSQARQAQLRMDIEKSRQETAEMEKIMAENKAKNKAAAKKASLTSWEEFTTKDKTK